MFKAENKAVPNVKMLIGKIYEIVEMDILIERIKDGKIDRIKNIWKLCYDWLDEEIL